MIRGAGPALETYWVRRSDAVAFMPGFAAFVGGSVDPDDAELPLDGAADPADHALRACAIREAFEETGVLLALTTGAPEAAQLHEARGRLLAGSVTFSALAREHGWRFRADALEPAGRWQTPAFAAVRFDTSYFLARVPAGQEPEIRVGELASGEWIRPAAALERYRAGDVAFAAPILHTLDALAKGEDQLAARLREAPARVGQPVRRIEIKWGVVLHPMKTRPLPPATHTNAYLIGERDVALVDPGSNDPAELDVLDRLIASLAPEGRRLSLIILTHHHADHAAGAAALRERYNIPIAAHRAAKRHVPVDLELPDGHHLKLGADSHDWTLRVLHTPGHTRDSLCLLHERTGSLFSGDLVPGGRGTVIIDPPDGDMSQYVESLRRLLRERVEVIFPGHGSPQGGAARRIQGLIDHRLERERKVLEALTAELQPLEALVPKAYADTPQDLWKYAERSLLAHLLKLGEEGKARREGESWRRHVKAT
jgi:ribonuclease/clavin/mitogillin